MAVEEDNDGNEQTQREGIVRLGLVGLVEGVRFAELLLMMLKLLLLLWGQDSKFPLLLGIFGVGGAWPGDGRICRR